MAITLTLPTPPAIKLPRIVWIGIGVVCISLLIWLLGPLIGWGSFAPLASWKARLGLIAVIIAVVAGVYVWRRIKAQKANDAMIRDLAQPAADPDEDLSAADVKAMEERATKALALMRDGRVGREQELVYELPWYVIIGPPGAGKTTALQNAGLHFPASQSLGAAPIRGIGGTRTCEWWFTDRAVLIDTAGRYTTQDSHAAVDAKSWNGLLDILKRYRPRQPVTGVIVAISVTELLAADEGTVLAHGRAVRARINEIAQKFGVRVPVYLLMTKLDLLAGFTEFFDNFDATTREQVWGHTFELEGEAKSQLQDMPAAYAALVQRLGDRLLDRTQAERDVQRRGLIFAFPQQFASLEAPLTALLEVIGRETRFEPTPLLRGFFFTSGTQAGRPIDRLLSSIAARFGVAEAASGGGGPKGRSYFLQNLLEKVIFAEAAIAGRDPKAERRRRTLRLGVIAGSAAACALLTVAWLFGWAANTRLIHVLEQRTAKLQADVQTISQGDVSDSDLGAILPVLNEARSLPFASTASKAERSAGFSFGVGQAGALRPQVDGAYHNLLNRQLLPRLILVVEDRLRALTTGSETQAKDAQSRTYNLLRVYLMLGRAPGAPLQKAQIQGWFEDAWAERYPGEEDTPTREALSGHLSALLSGPLSPPSLDRDLVATARQQVAGLSPGERVYSRLVDDPELRALAPYDISSVAEVSSSGLFTMKSGRSMALGVPGMFRRGSFYGPVMTAIGKAAAEASDETWVTGEESHGSSVAQAGRVKDGILIAYLADFTRHWDDYIGDIGISAKYPMDERIHRAVRPPSPVKALFASLATETNLIPPSLAPGKGGSGVAALRTAALFSHTIYSGVARADQVAAANTAASGPSQKGPLDEVIDHYGWLRDMQPPRGPSPLDDALEALKDTGDSTQAAKAATGVGDALLQKDKTSAAMASAAKLKSASSGLPPAAGSLFTGFVSASTSALNASAKGALNQAWTTGVLPECKSVLVQGFPFSPSDHQVSLDDFGRLFRPGGLIDAFRTANLAGDIDEGGTWRPSVAGKALNLSETSIRQMQRAAAIRQAFFKPGDVRPNVRFVLEPVNLPANATAVTLTIDGTPAAFDASARKSVELHWPGGVGGVTLGFQIGRGAPVTHSWNGDWAFAKMLAEAKITGATSEGLIFETGVETYRATFRMRFLNTTNPFTLPDLRTFACPLEF